MENLDNTLKNLTPEAFAGLGVNHVAYVRVAEVDGATVYSIHTADGRQVGLMPSWEVAFAAIRQHDLEPVSVH